MAAVTGLYAFVSVATYNGFVFAGDNGAGVPDLAALLQQRLSEADADPMAPPYDELRLYAYEGGNDTPVDLSEIEDNDDEDADFDFLNAWGPRFEASYCYILKENLPKFAKYLISVHGVGIVGWESPLSRESQKKGMDFRPNASR